MTVQLFGMVLRDRSGESHGRIFGSVVARLDNLRDWCEDAEEATPDDDADEEELVDFLNEQLSYQVTLFQDTVEL